MRGKSVYEWCVTGSSTGISPLIAPLPVPALEPRAATATELLDVLALTAAILEAGACTEHWARCPATRCHGLLSYIPVNDPQATHFCLEGAIVRAGWELGLLNEREVTIDFNSVDWITLKPLAELMEADLNDRRGKVNPFATGIAGWWDSHGNKRRALALLSRIAHQLGGK